MADGIHVHKEKFFKWNVNVKDDAASSLILCIHVFLYRCWVDRKTTEEEGEKLLVKWRE